MVFCRLILVSLARGHFLEDESSLQLRQDRECLMLLHALQDKVFFGHSLSQRGDHIDQEVFTLDGLGLLWWKKQRGGEDAEQVEVAIPAWVLGGVWSQG